MLTIEGRNLILELSMRATPRYLGLIASDYTPDGTETAANLPERTTESVSYSAGTRPLLTLRPAAKGATDNGQAVATFNFGAGATIYGAFVSTSQAKGGVDGELISIVRFPSPKTVAAGEPLNVYVPVALPAGN